MNDLAVVLLIGAGAFALRASFLAFAPGWRPPPGLDRRLRALGPAAVAAMLAVALLTDGRRVSVTSWPTVVGCAVAFAAVRRSGRLPIALVIGFPIIWTTSALI
jgi:branched-subunit amino acid transport protein